MTTPQRLLDDSRGALLIPALIAAVVLTAGAFEIDNVRQALMHRELLQSGADIAAGEAARWHAQGMNLLVLINILMAAVLSILVAIRAVQLIALAAAIVGAIVAVVTGGAGAGVAAGALRAAERAYNLERKAAPKIMTVLEWGTQVERWVAAVTPYVATIASAITTAEDDFEGVGFAGGLSLAPTAIDEGLHGTGALLVNAGRNAIPSRPGGRHTQPRSSVPAGSLFPVRMGGKLDQGAVPPALARRLPDKVRSAASFLDSAVGSLPVDEDPYAQLCSRATENLVKVIPGDLGALENAAAAIGGNLPTLLCEPLTEVIGGLEDDLNRKAPAEARSACEREEREDRAAQQRAGEADPPPWGGVRRRRCRQDRERDIRENGKKGLDEQRRKNRELKQQNQERTNNIFTAKLWNLISDAEAPAKGNNVFLHVWSAHTAPALELNVGLRRPPILIWNGQPVPNLDLSASFDPNVSAAKAAFYNPRATVESSTGVHGATDEALWRIGWSYKLDPYWDAPSEILRDGNQALVGWFDFVAGEATTRMLGKVTSLIGSHLTARPPRHRNPTSHAQPSGNDHSRVWLERLVGGDSRQRAAGRIHYLYYNAGSQVRTGGSATALQDYVWIR